ncbi:urease accessory protein UreF [Paenibacillus beijingensis]|uniref:Urease accessory protein UreF n=1 Tax=Paenibacillus beijingensis TaxID=1126833 RepID=A0A0D5NLD4_9BACL|nr:urease accessory UreF family protein [Paenibacillus beijingensis]AJY76124.1 urease accessory protein UreF [Paenibacillus beijingensis]
MDRNVTVANVSPGAARVSIPWLAFQQLLDSALPIGGFSHSFGLETLVQEGRIRTTAQLRQYAENMMLMSWATSDAMVIKAAYRDMPGGDWERLWAVERLVHVQRAALEARTGVEKMGRRLLQLAADIFPAIDWEPLQTAQRNGACIATHPLVLGYASFQLEISLVQAVEGYLYNCVVTCINSALRLMSMGQTEGQRLIAAIMPLSQRALEIVQELEPEDAWSNMPMAELAMIRHETLYSRLFMS